MSNDTPEVPRGIQADAVSQWIVDHVDGLEPPFTFALITGGHSNLTYSVDDAAGRRIVLRRPPLGAVLATAHDMGREHRIISALVPTDMPVPRTLALCDDESVNDAPFYLMDYVDGVVLATAQTVADSVPESQRDALGERVIEVLATLHSIDPDDVGLGKLGRKDGYIERQLKRWSIQWEKSKTRELPAMETVHRLLEERVPEQIGSAVVHGDYRLGNMLVTPDDAGVAAVLDWELCTLGDPMADVGYLMNDWAPPGSEGVQLTGSPTSAGGFPSRERMMERYAELTGRDTSLVPYYRAFQAWRLAAIGEGVLARYLKGVMAGKGDTEGMKKSVETRAELALELLEA